MLSEVYYTGVIIYLMLLLYFFVKIEFISETTKSGLSKDIIIPFLIMSIFSWFSAIAMLILIIKDLCDDNNYE